MSSPNSEVKIQSKEMLVEAVSGGENGSEVSENMSMYKKIPSTIKLNPIKPNLKHQTLNHPLPIIPSLSSFAQQPISLKRYDDNKHTSMESSGASPTRFKRIKKGYQLASYSKAVDYLNSQSYRRKVINPNDGGEQFEMMEVCGNNQQLRNYGLGVYLYFQFIKRLTVALFIMSAILMFPLVKSYQGNGLANYTQSGSYSMTLARFSLGNISNGDSLAYYIITGGDVISILIMIIFYLHWRSFHKSAIQENQKNHQIVNPVSYALSVEDFFDSTTNLKTLEEDLRAYIDGIYKGAYEVEIVYNYNGQFDRFIEYDQQIEAVEKENQIIKQTKGQTNNLVELEQKLEKIEGELMHISQAFQPIYAIIHFRTLKSKLSFLNHCKRFKLLKTTGQAFQRMFCCTPSPPQRLLFLNRFPLMIRNNKLSRPEEINWRNTDLSSFSLCVRFILAALLVVLSIAITSAMIGFCTLYVASTSSCQNYVTPDPTIYTTTAAQIAYVKSQSSSSSTYCYCSANFQSIYTDTTINAFCASISNQILITNGLQIAASIVSAITNTILGIVITLLAQKLLRPNTVPKEYVFIFWGVLISNYINSSILPLMLNANIFGVQFISYIKFINFMDFSSISIFSDFTVDWYALISPYYITMVIIGSFISPLIGLIIFSLKSCFNNWRIQKMCEDNDKENPIIQKEANAKLASLTFDYASETAQILLYLFISFMYSGLLPVMIPILTLGMIITYFCKRAIVLKYSVKIPADEMLNESVISFMPIIILLHALFSVWSHTAPGIFASGSSIITFNWTIFNSIFDRVFGDIIILGELALILLIIILDQTIFNFFGCLAQCCKEELEMPVQFASIQNSQYSERLAKVNILGSYKLVNNPTYGHALKAYNQLIFRNKKMDQTKDPLNPEMFN